MMQIASGGKIVLGWVGVGDAPDEIRSLDTCLDQFVSKCAHRCPQSSTGEKEPTHSLRINWQSR